MRHRVVHRPTSRWHARSLLWCCLATGCGFDLTLVPGDAVVVATCNYPLALPSSTSRYLLVDDRLAWRFAEAGCETQRAHLFVPTTSLEVTDMQRHVTEPRWVGLVQPSNQTNQAAGWRILTGDLHQTGWSIGKPDDGGNGEDGTEQAAVIGPSGLDDDNHRTAKPYICECDEIAVDASLATMLPL